MLKVTVSSQEQLEHEVDDAINKFGEWFKTIQSDSDGVKPGLTGPERSIIKTFAGYYLGVGGYYTPPKED